LSGTEPSLATSTSLEGARMGVRHKGERKKRCLPLEIRLRLHDEVLQLRGQGLSYKEIIEEIHRLNRVRLDKSHISDWVRRKHEPLGGINTFNGKPSPELAGLIGTMLSDGGRFPHGSSKAFWLGVKDREYIHEFGRCLAKILGRKKPYKICWSPSKQRWVLESRSILLFNHLDKPWQNLKPYIEHRKDCTAAFLRAFFDGEGSIHKRQLTAHNTDRELLLYIKELLKRCFDIDSTGPHLSQKSGTVLHCPHTGKSYKTKKDCYHIYIRTHSLPRFYKEIEFTIRRKQRRLAEAAKQ